MSLEHFSIIGCGVGRTSRSVRMGPRPTNSDENHVGRASTPAAGLQTRLSPNRLRWVFDCARVLQDPLWRLASLGGAGCTLAPLVAGVGPGRKASLIG